MKILFVNACVHTETSRTYRLAKELISRFPDAEVEEVVLEKAGLQSIDTEKLEKRTIAIEDGDLSDPVFDHAKKMIDADIVIMASPFWESMFNSLLKTYLENVSVPGLVYRYNNNGIPIGKSKGRLFYVTTRGGQVTDRRDLGVAVMKNLAFMFGFKEFTVFSAYGLDIVGNDAERIMEKALSRIDTARLSVRAER